MERFSHRESVLLGYNNSTTTQRPSLSSCNNSTDDIDFTDVFGGPPRRVSMQDSATMYSLESETRPKAKDSGEYGNDDDDDETMLSFRGRWSGLGGRPVFGDNERVRKCNVGDDFFDDIFKGSESLNSSPRRIDRDPFSCSSPGSRGLSPVRALPPWSVEPPLSSSVPAQFSLPAKLMKGTDLPAFGLSNRKSKDALGSNGVNNYAHSPLSRSFSQVQEETRKQIHQKSTLAQQLSLNSNESSDSTKPDEKEKGSNTRSESRRLEAPLNGDQFHFSIYKWATKGIPLSISSKGGNKKDKVKLARSSSTNARTMVETDFLLFTDGSLNKKSCVIEPDKQENCGSNFDANGRDGVESYHIVEEAILSKPLNETSGKDTVVVEDVPATGNKGNTTIPNSREKINGRADHGTGLFGKLAQEISDSIRQSPKIEQKKPLRALFSDDIDEKDTKGELKESKVKIAKKSSAVFDVSDKVMKPDGKGETLNRKDMDKPNVSGSPSIDSLGKNKPGGKVKDFVRIFNQEAQTKPKSSDDCNGQSSQLKERGAYHTKSEDDGPKSAINGSSRWPSVNMNHKNDAPVTVDQPFWPSEKEDSDVRTKNAKPRDFASETNEGLRSASGSLSDDSRSPGDIDDSFHANFMIQEITLDEEKLPKSSTDHDEIKAIDAKILNWSKGKEGNVRSLLSTLQYVLWPESGWKPVPLVDIIEGSAVRRSYQKALLCLHPDKLQQKGASATQKHIAAKVFDILQEAWDHFNSLGAV